MDSRPSASKRGLAHSQSQKGPVLPNFKLAFLRQDNSLIHNRFQSGRKQMSKGDPFVKRFTQLRRKPLVRQGKAVATIRERTMKIGYARVSTDDQNLDLQIAALNSAGCSHLFSDHGISGSEFSRPGLRCALEALSAGDTLVVWRLDRLGRSLRKLVELIDELGARNVEFLSLNECINTTSSGGVLIFHVMAALAQFERSLISERTRAGMAAARKRGQHLGRRRSLSHEQCEEARGLLAVSPLKAVAAKFDVHPRTLQRMLYETPSGILSAVTAHDPTIGENVCAVTDSGSNRFTI